MSRLTNRDRHDLREVVSQLTTGREEHGHLADELMPHLDALRVWLDTWVVPKVQRVLDNDSNQKPRTPRKRSR